MERIDTVDGSGRIIPVYKQTDWHNTSDTETPFALKAGQESYQSADGNPVNLNDDGTFTTLDGEILTPVSS